MSLLPIKTFNVSGPCVSGKHYLLPVLFRQTEVQELIDGEFYFVLRAPRQSGKTTFLNFLTDKINSEGQFYAINCSIMSLKGDDDVKSAIKNLYSVINHALYSSTVEIIKQKTDIYRPKFSQKLPNRLIRFILNSLCEDLDKELIVFFDEADCLAAKPLAVFLSQIKEAYRVRCKPGNKFPRSLALVGTRDIRDRLTYFYQNDPSKGPPNPFNIVKESLILPNFTKEEIGALYRQHTEASGQIFEDLAIERAWYWSEGQPWLANALARQAVVEILKNDYSAAVDDAIIDKAVEALITRRDAHLDSLMERLYEPRISRIVESVIIGAPRPPSAVTKDDRRYALDLGILKRESGVLKPANPIYQEVILRALSSEYEEDEFGQSPTFGPVKPLD